MSTVISEPRAIASADDSASQRLPVCGPARGSGTAKHATGRRTPLLTATVRSAILTAAALTLLLTGCTTTETGHPSAAPDLGRWQPPAVLPQHLADLLLKDSDVNTIAHTTAMAVRKPISQMWHDEETVSNPGCLDIYQPAEAAVYQGSNWTALQGQILDDAAPVAPKHALMQALIGFRDADSAQQFFSQAKTRWSGCANQSITVITPGHAPLTWNLGEPQTTDTTLAATQTHSGPSVASCQRAMGIANNVIIDALWCGLDITTQASDIVAKTTAGISRD
ncbi:sensor domain-containing protein [Mycobacterium intracellulare]|uniref:sensor domain-containing protein n=1 Tax=Mycobacterium intracellulare TaxID=1767 RepID=UPI000C799910|nr:sensor domain-containing protein [Mycobacterium intracellulare]